MARGSAVQSVERAARLLRGVAAAASAGSTTAALARSCNLNRATAWRILSTLAADGLVVNHRETGRWSLGTGVLDLVRMSGLDAVLHDVHEALEHVALQTGETAALATMRKGALSYVDEVAPAAVVAVSWVGRPLSLHGTSTGKVLLAWSDAADLPRLLPRRLPAHTSATITDRARLRAHLAETRQRGYATCQGEFDDAAWGVSTPVLDATGHLVAVLSIWGPPPRVTAERFPALAEVCREAAARVAPGA